MALAIGLAHARNMRFLRPQQRIMAIFTPFPARESRVFVRVEQSGGHFCVEQGLSPLIRLRTSGKAFIFNLSNELSLNLASNSVR